MKYYDQKRGSAYYILFVYGNEANKLLNMVSSQYFGGKIYTTAIPISYILVHFVDGRVAEGVKGFGNLALFLSNFCLKCIDT